MLTESKKKSSIEEVAVEMHDPNVTEFTGSEHRKGGWRGPKRKIWVLTNERRREMPFSKEKKRDDRD